MMTSNDSNIFLKVLKQEVLKEDDQASVILFGSRARGDFRPMSDWDILILTSKEADVILQDRLRDAIYMIELKYMVPVSTIIRSKKEWDKLSITPFYKNVTAEGKML